MAGYSNNSFVTEPRSARIRRPTSKVRSLASPSTNGELGTANSTTIRGACRTRAPLGPQKNALNHAGQINRPHAVDALDLGEGLEPGPFEADPTPRKSKSRPGKHPSPIKEQRTQPAGSSMTEHRSHIRRRVLHGDETDGMVATESYDNRDIAGQTAVARESTVPAEKDDIMSDIVDVLAETGRDSAPAISRSFDDVSMSRRSPLTNFFYSVTQHFTQSAWGYESGGTRSVKSDRVTSNLEKSTHDDGACPGHEIIRPMDDDQVMFDDDYIANAGSDRLESPKLGNIVIPKPLRYVKNAVSEPKEMHRQPGSLATPSDSANIADRGVEHGSTTVRYDSRSTIAYPTSLESAVEIEANTNSQADRGAITDFTLDDSPSSRTSANRYWQNAISVPPSRDQRANVERPSPVSSPSLVFTAFGIPGEGNAKGQLPQKPSSDHFNELMAGKPLTSRRPLDFHNHKDFPDVRSSRAHSAAQYDIPFPHLSDDEVGVIVGACLEESRSDNEYWIHTCLRQAYSLVEDVTRSISEDHPTSVFKELTPLIPIKSSEQPDKRTAKFKVENFYGNKSAKPTWILECEMITPNDLDIPNYSHYVSLRRNVLAHNDQTLLHWPYFSDDFNNRNYSNVRSVYFLDVEHRERKLVSLLKAENLSKYIEIVLQELNITWFDVLYFLLALEPDVGKAQSAIIAKDRRDTFCEEDFTRDGKRWATLTSKLPAPTPERTGRAAILCQMFQKKTDFPLWQLARRSDIVTNLLKSEEEVSDLYDLTCRVCMRFDCPHHGELQESQDAKEPSNKTEFNVVETDIIQPMDVNERLRVGFPVLQDDEIILSANQEKRNLQYWQHHAYSAKVDERGPFYPCHHPGETCSENHCSCFTSNIPCEKTCGCSLDCPRKYQGCLCSTGKLKKGQKLVCFEDERCSCFQLGRECDPDLCGTCGVCEVVDPAHRHNDQILNGRCRNASLQRGVSKHTILGESGIHGLGLYACEGIREHDFVGEYRGEIITKDEAERRGAVYQHQKLSYLFTLNNDQEIDSTYFGNKIRFINHATDKDKACNLYPRIIMVNTVHRIALYGKRSIKPGEELFFDYGPQFPNEQLGGNAENKARKSAPHVRNALLVKGFYPVEETTDKHGNVRARKAGYASAWGSKYTARRGGLTYTRGRRGGASTQRGKGNSMTHGQFPRASSAVRVIHDHSTGTEDDETDTDDAHAQVAPGANSDSYSRKRKHFLIESSGSSDEDEYGTGRFQPSTDSDPEYE